MSVEGLPGGRRADALGQSLEQHGVQGPFELAQLAGERRLRDAQVLGRS